MDTVSKEQIRRFRLHAHHLDAWYPIGDAEAIAGACGLQNSPPGAWETALHSRVQDCTRDGLRQMLEEEKTLLQAWSFRGAPVVFPTADSSAFLSALVPEPGEPWVYTQGIPLALDFLGMSFDEVFAPLLQVIPGLEGITVKSKTALDQTLADWVAPLLPGDKRDLWNSPSMYGSPDRQTVGGAAVSFLLRPCALRGHVVFGKREGISPTFTAYQSWVSHPLEENGTPARELARKYLRCFGPASAHDFAEWLGCAPAQAERMWRTVADEVEPVSVSGRVRYILSADKHLLISPPKPERDTHLLGGHDPYLGLQDREIILDNRACQLQIWQTVSNPGAVLWQGEIVGMWKPRKKGRALDIGITLWDGARVPKDDLSELAERCAVFQQLKLNNIAFLT